MPTLSPWDFVVAALAFIAFVIALPFLISLVYYTTPENMEKRYQKNKAKKANIIQFNRTRYVK